MVIKRRDDPEDKDFANERKCPLHCQLKHDETAKDMNEFKGVLEEFKRQEYVTMKIFLIVIGMVIACLAGMTSYGLIQSSELHKELAVETVDRIKQRIDVTNEMKDMIQLLREDISELSKELHHQQKSIAKSKS